MELFGSKAEKRVFASNFMLMAMFTEANGSTNSQKFKSKSFSALQVCLKTKKVSILKSRNKVRKMARAC